MAGRKPTAAALTAYEQVLRALRREISGDIDRLEADALAGDGVRVSVDNLADIGTDSFSQEFSLELLEHDGEILGEIDEALARLAGGTFGRCESCGQWITTERLRAMPYAKNCIACQRELEHEG